MKPAVGKPFRIPPIRQLAKFNLAIGHIFPVGHLILGSMYYHHPMGDLGRLLVFVGGILLVIGLVLLLAGKANLPIGRLPGDLVYRGRNTTFYFPLMTSIVLSLVFSLVLYFVNRMR